MSWRAAVAQGAWLAAGTVAARRFRRALTAPRETQASWLALALGRHAGSAFGRQYDFATIPSPAAFARRVPLQTWEDVAPWVARVQAGEAGVLTSDTVTHLVPTSGSTGARKLIPFTRGLAAAFDAAVAPWMHALVRERPALLTGPSYWSISPLAEGTADPPSAVPIGFADDADYLGGAAAWLVRQALAVPAAVRHVRDVDAFWGLTRLALLRRADLRLVSVWHPSFLDCLVDIAADEWALLLDAIATGETPWRAALPPTARAGHGAWRASPDPMRADGLRRAGRHDWSRWWPALQVMSCWGEQAAAAGWLRLRQRLPGVLVQAKGLLATEGVVTIPLADRHPLAVTSHFFEFLDEAGEVRGAHQLERGRTYEVVLTNGAGLWRYRLGDAVECDGVVGATPSLRFVGRIGRVSDLRGEKLAEPFVAEVLRAAWDGAPPPLVARLEARTDEVGAGYVLVVSDDAPVALDHCVARVEAGLAANPHYALARRLGQLAPLAGRRVPAAHAHEDLHAGRGRLGDAKPRTLVGVA